MRKSENQPRLFELRQHPHFGEYLTAHATVAIMPGAHVSIRGYRNDLEDVDILNKPALPGIVWVEGVDRYALVQEDQSCVCGSSGNPACGGGSWRAGGGTQPMASVYKDTPSLKINYHKVCRSSIGGKMKCQLLAIAWMTSIYSSVCVAKGGENTASSPHSCPNQPQDFVVCTGWHALCTASLDCKMEGDKAYCDCMRVNENHIVETDAIQDTAVKRMTGITCTNVHPGDVDQAPVCKAIKYGEYAVDNVMYEWVSAYSYRGWCMLLNLKFRARMRNSWNGLITDMLENGLT